MDGSRYWVFGPFFQGAEFVLDEARDLARKIPVILKRPLTWDSQLCLLLKNEYEAGRDLSLEGVVRVLDHFEDSRGPVLVLENFGGFPLPAILMKGPLDPDRFFRVALEALAVVERLHALGISHNNLSLESVLVKESNLQVKLAGILPPEPGPEKGPARDLLAMGRLLYILFTSREPPLEDPRLVREKTPLSQVLAVVEKAASPVRRYHSLAGLKADLVRCWREWEENGRVAAFEPGLEDLAESLRPPSRLYGRHRETAALESAFAGACQGGRSLVLISGYSGVGKTALVRDFARQVREQGGLFIQGKCGQQGHDAPSAPLVEALGDLARQAAGLGDSWRAGFRERFVEALGRAGGVITSILPELEVLVGPQPPLDALPHQEQGNRFLWAAQAFASVLGTPEMPLVLFLDDLQWGDASLFAWINLLVGNPKVGHFLLVGAFRDNETPDDHPLWASLPDLKQAGQTPLTLPLFPLERESTRQMVADMLGRDTEICQPLADLCHDKTSGNPLFLGQFLSDLEAEGLLRHDRQRSRWAWDAEAIGALTPIHDAGPLVEGRIQRLGSLARETLLAASCLSGSFDAEKLSTLTERDLDGISRDLSQARGEGLLRQADPSPGYGLPGFLFSHDAIQKAAYGMQEPGLAARRHLALACLGKDPGDLAPGEVFEWAGHANRARELICEPGDRKRAAVLNLTAARLAASRSAHQAARLYLEEAMALLGPGAWSEEYALALEIHTRAARAAFREARFDLMERWAEEVLENSTDIMGRVPACQVLFQGYFAQERMAEGVDAALALLGALGIRLPRKPNDLNVLWWAHKVRRKMAGKSPEEILTAPEMTDPAKKAIMEILGNLLLSAYLLDPKISLISMFQSVILSLDHGCGPGSASAFSGYGFILAGFAGDLSGGYRMGMLAMDLMKRFPDPGSVATVMHNVETCARPWIEPIRNSPPGLWEGYRKGLETGNFHYAAFCAYSWSCLKFFQGETLGTLFREMSEMEESLARIGQEVVCRYIRLNLQVVSMLMGLSPGPGALSGDTFEESGEVHLLQGDCIGLYALEFNRMYVAHFFGRYHEAVAHFENLLKNKDGGSGAQVGVQTHYFGSLSILAVVESQSFGKARRDLKKVKKSMGRLEHWASHCSQNHQHRYDLVRARYLQVLGRTGEAENLYESAAARAAKNGFIQDEAMACELAGKFHLQNGDKPQGLIFLERARSRYLTWEAHAKVRQLDDQFGRLF